ncbi:alpha/beta hydrolase [Rhodococcus sp. IEGM 248]|uniref:alpha/beta fold hydrolase n=1 Tax=Rhodococcus TaxID=1827 RepID=UPI0013C1A0D5|nr:MULTISPECIES: alpha/beta hydrolase [Rhodococcus]MDI9952394.1 alpha/beta hydrolase [Rhodococcus sp. IEGM 1305]MDV7087738.1 alpha/beta hydrolase [Rhodococcus opacus]NDV05515.1 alpha/beta hydrolase [Rhodococcus sp. IEGM 248]
MPNRQRLSRWLPAVGVVLLVAACGTDDGDGASKDFAGTVDIGGDRHIYLECAGTGSPTVVFESGLRFGADQWTTTADPAATSAFDGVAEFTRVCSYDRPGVVLGDDALSRSDPVPQPITTTDAVADLQSLLGATGEAGPGPYVLAAHSYGGQIARLFAGTHPDEVAGMVLIDAQSEELQTLLPPEQFEEFLRLNTPQQDSLDEYPDLERVDFVRSFDEIRAAEPIRPQPLVVLSADRSVAPQIAEGIANGSLPADIDPGYGPALDAVQPKAQADLAQLVPGATHVTNTNSGHNINIEQPQLVIDGVRDVVDAVRDGRTEP